VIYIGIYKHDSIQLQLYLTHFNSSIGVIINEILTRERPYQDLLEEGLSYENIFSRISKESLKVSTRFNDDEYTDKVNAIIRNCIQSDPFNRPTCASLRVNNFHSIHSLDLYSKKIPFAHCRIK
jgi:serine/threonine protein kinase